VPILLVVSYEHAHNLNDQNNVDAHLVAEHQKLRAQIGYAWPMNYMLK